MASFPCGAHVPLAHVLNGVTSGDCWCDFFYGCCTVFGEGLRGWKGLAFVCMEVICKNWNNTVYKTKILVLRKPNVLFLDFANHVSLVSKVFGSMDFFADSQQEHKEGAWYKHLLGLEW